MASGSPFTITSVSATHPGLVRRRNEDAFLDREDIGLWAVADGMGGHDAGDLASGTIVSLLDAIDQPIDGAALLAAVRTAIEEANSRLLSEARRRGPESLIGSTVVVMIISEGYFACLWAGDSRLYRLRAGVLEQLTIDHSQVQELVKSGSLTPDEAERHPLSNIITRAVGTDDALILDKISERLADGDIYLICSDGLSKMVQDTDIADQLRTQPTRKLPAALIDLALRNGGKDNVTVVAVRIDADKSAEETVAA